MKIVSKIFKIKCEEPVTLDFMENYFSEHSMSPVRWAIVDVTKNELTLNAAIVEK